MGCIILENDCLAVDIGNSFIKVMVGNDKNIKFCDMLPTPEGSMQDGKIVNPDAIRYLLDSYIKQKYTKTKCKNISFVIHGQDIIIRHTEFPFMDEKGLKNAVEWEMGQYLPQGGNLHYIDYEIIDKLNTREKKMYKLLVVAAPRDKIDQLVNIAQGLQLKINAIDISANCIARTVKKSFQLDKSIGIIDIGNKTTSFEIIDDGKLFIERGVIKWKRLKLWQCNRNLNRNARGFLI